MREEDPVPASGSRSERSVRVDPRHQATVPPMNPDTRTLFDADNHIAELGARLVEDEDSWSIELQIAERHLNFLELGHGAVVFALADFALSLASNAAQENAYAVDMNISFVRGARLGDTLRAMATPERTTRALGWYRIDVTNQRAEQIAVCRGTVYRPGSH